ncbi:hypothetical protein XENOCAPTIV_009561 [Xenoophorus captivus]|uniref:Uncharacterized protein n=1 Tax=Xenoophorus captivus TaxID=1517983 RepID=A0ABV0S927_9TELE
MQVSALSPHDAAWKATPPPNSAPRLKASLPSDTAGRTTSGPGKPLICMTEPDLYSLNMGRMMDRDQNVKSFPEQVSSNLCSPAFLYVVVCPPGGGPILLWERQPTRLSGCRALHEAAALGSEGLQSAKLLLRYDSPETEHLLL